MVMPAGLAPDDRGRRLADPRLRREVEAVVKRRVRADDADDIVQAALADVLSAARVPEDAEEFRRFVFAVTRNKVFDHFRRRMREVPEEAGHEPAASEEPLSARDILRWAEGKLPDPEAEHTLHWMLREGDGEKLEQIARDANLPAPRVRKRVSRLRRFLRERWAAELMLGALGLALLTPLAVYYYRQWFPPPGVVEQPPQLRPEQTLSPEARGRELRRLALEHCPQQAAQECLAGLDRARTLDPAGDSAAEVVNARRAAAARLAPPAPAVPSVIPTSSAAPRRHGAPRTIDTGEGPIRLPPRVTPQPSLGSDSSLTPSKP
ncbi:MAG TPA: sigma-70 family RNA polymerase sigma factor [Polyangiaceae bacterium]|jgi:RNA polymerase sigma factor (sigma-70 family)